MKRIGRSESCLIAATILSPSGANCESTIRTPSGPASTPIVPPCPSRVEKFPAIFVVLICTWLMSGGCAAARALPVITIAAVITPTTSILMARSSVSCRILCRMTELNATRRTFMAHFASIGLGATLAPGVIWARMQDAGAKTITLDMVADAMKLSGLEFTPDELKGMVDAANQNLTRYQEQRAIHDPNDVSPPFHFSAIVPGMEVNKAKLPFKLSAPPAVKRPLNLEDVAFWPVRHLAELLRTKQVTSLELTEMYLARLHRYNGLLNNVVTFLDDHGRAEARRADAEIAAGKYKGPLHGIPW